MYFQAEASVCTYGALPTAVLSKTYSGVRQLEYELTYSWRKLNRHDASLLDKGGRQ